MAGLKQTSFRQADLRPGQIVRHEKEANPDDVGAGQDVPVNMSGANLDEANLRHANMDQANLTNVSAVGASFGGRSEEHTSELQSLMRISSAVFCLTKKKKAQTRIS